MTEIENLMCKYTVTYDIHVISQYIEIWRSFSCYRRIIKIKLERIIEPPFILIIYGCVLLYSCILNTATSLAYKSFHVFDAKVIFCFKIKKTIDIKIIYIYIVDYRRCFGVYFPTPDPVGIMK